MLQGLVSLSLKTHVPGNFLSGKAPGIPKTHPLTKLPKLDTSWPTRAVRAGSEGQRKVRDTQLELSRRSSWRAASLRRREPLSLGNKQSLLSALESVCRPFFWDSNELPGLASSTAPTTLTETITPTPPSTTTGTATTIPPITLSGDEIDPTETDPYSPLLTDEDIDEYYREQPNDGVLSTGAQAGIGVGAAVGVVGLIAGGFFFYHRHKMRTPAKTIREISEGPSEGEL
ncbi:hypothetical protein BJY01DRAFT_167640 [Aspergillus pseudoustus]|uniref:Uncharacterized protein n=1 Tax=Aspergillus pseudoustus TaxID=1810923 RepID=A0ABR4K4D8_9EURO